MSFLQTLRAGPPPPKVALLPDGLFFSRAVAIAAGASAGDAAAQIELALESFSPFPLTQLYYGYFWKPGAETALVFAAYRRRFTSDQTATWDGAEQVLPAFATLLGAEVQPATTFILASPEGLTAVHWATPAAPSQMIFRPLAAEATDEDRAKLRESLIAAMGGSQHVRDFDAPPAPQASITDREVTFRSGDFESRFSASAAAALDARDKAELSALRLAHKRDVILWRAALVCVAVLALLALGEVGLKIGAAWQKRRLALQHVQEPVVQQIMDMKSAAMHIEDLATKRLLPLEMLTAVLAGKPADVIIDRAITNGLYTIRLDVQTTNSAQMSVYESALRNLPSLAAPPDVKLQPGAGNLNRFTVTLTFKPGALEPASS